VRIPRDSEALYLLQQVRDEAHRFAITYHRQLRGKKMTTSVLDDVPGLGPTRRRRLLKEFGSVKKLRELDEQQLLALPWLPDAVTTTRRATGWSSTCAPVTSSTVSPVRRTSCTVRARGRVCSFSMLPTTCSFDGTKGAGAAIRCRTPSASWTGSPASARWWS